MKELQLVVVAPFHEYRKGYEHQVSYKKADKEVHGRMYDLSIKYPEMYVLAIDTNDLDKEYGGIVPYMAYKGGDEIKKHIPLYLREYDSNNFFDNDDIECMRESELWKVCYSDPENMFNEISYNFKDPILANEKAKFLSTVLPDVSVMIERYARIRRTFHNGKMVNDYKDFKDLYFNDGSKRFQSSSKIWSEIV